MYTVVSDSQGMGVEPTAKRSPGVSQMTMERAHLIKLMDIYLAALLDPFITLPVIHSLMYFLQEACRPWGLDFHIGADGPTAKKTYQILNELEGYLTTECLDENDASRAQLSLLPGAVPEALRFLRSHVETNHCFDRVVRLIDGFETPFGLELLFIVHWVIRHERVNPQEAIIQSVNSRLPAKRKFSPTQIQLATNRLTAQGWFSVSTSS